MMSVYNFKIGELYVKYPIGKHGAEIFLVIDKEYSWDRERVTIQFLLGKEIKYYYWDINDRVNFELLE